jgi:hypothetical protein
MGPMSEGLNVCAPGLLDTMTLFASDILSFLVLTTLDAIVGHLH